MTEADQISLASQCLTYLAKNGFTKKEALEVGALILNEKGMEMLKWNSTFLKMGEERA